jgi:hypothetical protein
MAPAITMSLVGVTLFAAFVGSWVWLHGHPHLTVINELVVPLQVTIGDSISFSVAPETSARLPVPRSPELRASWESAIPAGGGGIPVSGVMMVVYPANPLHDISIVVSARDSAARYFVPVVTNRTSQPLCVRVNHSPGGESSCDAMVAAGAISQIVGYFPAHESSSISAALPNGSTATAPAIGVSGASGSGRIDVKFSPDNFPGSP